jgi:hypothetical protein
MSEAGGSAGSGTTTGVAIPAAVIERAAARYGSIHTRWGRSQPWGTAASTLADRSAVSTSPIVEVGGAEEMPRVQRDAPERPRLALLDESSSEAATVGHDVAEHVPPAGPGGAPGSAIGLPAAQVVREPPPFPGYATAAQGATVANVAAVAAVTNVAADANVAAAAHDSVDGGETPRTSRSPRVWVLAAAAFAVAAALVPGAPGADPDGTGNAPPELAPRATTHALRPPPDQQPPRARPKQDQPGRLSLEPEPSSDEASSNEAPLNAAPLDLRPVGGPGRAQAPRAAAGAQGAQGPANPVGASLRSNPAPPAARPVATVKTPSKPARKLRPRRQKPPPSPVLGGIIRDSPF